LPLSLQIVGRPFDEATVLRAAFAYERATAWRKRRPVLDPAGSFSTALPRTPVPELVSDPATRDMVVTACHRAGLLLNEDQIAMICLRLPTSPR
jgi:aspartyl-tRNA(Asn)/glutamyl-tRNA(Gln) amidotransferase subunit A